MKLLFPLLAGLGAVLLYLVWAALFHDFLNGLSPEGPHRGHRFLPCL